MIYINDLYSHHRTNNYFIMSNSIFDDLSCGSGEFSGYHIIFFKDVTFLFYYFRFIYSDYVTTHSIYHTEIFLTF